LQQKEPHCFFTGHEDESMQAVDSLSQSCVDEQQMVEPSAFTHAFCVEVQEVSTHFVLQD
jgi:hypothetical protein